jgi:hypothetical protein
MAGAAEEDGWMTLYWTIFIVLIALGFIGGESYALYTGKQTLSRYVWTLSKAWPPLPWVVGLMTGAIATHFWWGGIVCFAPVQ